MERRHELIVLLVAAVIYLGTIISPPRLMDDVDSVQAQIARNMLESGDWVTARLNGVAYLEKSPLVYWLIAGSFAIFGVHDWAARLPIAFAAIALCWLTARMAAWAFSARAGYHAGLVMATCIGLWLFTRILIPDVLLTLAVTLAMWAFLRSLEDDDRRWSYVFWACIGLGLLLKGLIAAVFPIAAGIIYLAITRAGWRRLRPLTGVLITLVIAAPWYVAATLANPPYIDLTPRSEPGQYHGFFWFYFLNEHVFRFLNMRHPRDYNTVPRQLFWLFHLLWLFPWSVYLPRVFRLSYKPVDRAGRTRLLALCWAGFILAFFTLSTTQEYYSMPAYPALALLIASAMEQPAGWPRRAVQAIAAAGLAATLFLLVRVWTLPAPGDISAALTSNPEAYTLSLGHMGDLTIASFAYLKLPLVIAAVAFALGVWGRIAAMMVVFFHAARLALIVFDPYLGSFPLARALREGPPGRLIVDNQYYAFSSVFFYAHDRARNALLLNGRKMNLEYGSYAPGAPQVFIGDADLARLWSSSERHYLVFEKPELGRITALIGAPRVVLSAGGKFLVVNHARSD
jgi:4-amino-4-deoxy-L-arabinose transferase-like glycosyltransferase